MQCNLNTLKFKNNRSKCSNYINNARASLEFIIREILVEFLACHLITWVTLIQKQFSSQNDENLVQTQERSTKRALFVMRSDSLEPEA